jgi:thiol-disulfide isomerase/thioredoxin
VEDIAVDMAAAYGQDIEVVREPVLDTVRTFGAYGLLEGVRRLEPQAPSGPESIPVGEPAPGFELPDTSGQVHALADFAGSRTLLVNWSPRCGFCDRIAPELAGAQVALSDSGVQLVFVSIGEPEEVLANLDRLGLSPPKVLLAEPGTVEMFAGLGTPAAYLLDEQGRVLQPLAVGADKVPVLVMTALAPGTDG